MSLAYSLLQCWAFVKKNTSKTAEVDVHQPEAAMPTNGRKGTATIRSNGPAYPKEYFRRETLQYLNGDIQILDQLPAVQAMALREALKSKTRVIRPKKTTLSPPSVAEIPSQPRNPAPEHKRTPKLPPVTDKPTFSEMVQHAVPLAAIQTTQRPRTADEAGRNNTIRKDEPNANSAINTRCLRPAYDGLRSSPPWNSTSPHVWKLYAGPVFDSGSLTEHEQRGDHDCPREESKDHVGTALAPPLAPSPTSPRLEYATIAIRYTPKLISMTRRSHQGSSNRVYGLNPRSSSPAVPPLSAAFPLPPTLPPYYPPSPTPQPSSYTRTNHLPPGSSHHYTTREATFLISSLRSYLLLPDFDSLSPGQMIASLLLRWPSLRRRLPQRNPLLAARVNALDWSGVEADLPPGSFARRCVEGWMRSDGVLFPFGQQEEEEEEEEGRERGGMAV